MKRDCCILVLVTMLVGVAQAGDGDVIISRDVQTRVATVNPIVPDPHPRVVNPGSIATGVTAELGDSDFAGVSSGLALPQRLLQGNLGTPIPTATHQGIPVLGSGHAGGARSNGIADQVNRSVQQGLRPLQSIGGR